jgi:hypothetical protein
MSAHLKMKSVANLTKRADSVLYSDAGYAFSMASVVLALKPSWKSARC